MPDSLLCYVFDMSERGHINAKIDFHADAGWRSALKLRALLAALIGVCLAFSLSSCAVGSDTSDSTSGTTSSSVSSVSGAASSADSSTSSGELAVSTHGIQAKEIDSSDSSSGDVSASGDSSSNEVTDEGSSFADGDLIVRFLDVGEGDACLITCGDVSMMIDGGPSSASQKIYSILDRLGIERLDYVVMTHPDADHVGGVAAALTHSTCGRCFCSVDSYDTKTFSSVKSRLNEMGISIEIPSYGDTFNLGEANVMFVGPISRDNADSNNGSLVLRIDYGSTSFLFTGDAEQQEESDMVRAGVNLKADVLKVGHHGSSTSSIASFLSKVSPKYAIISVGEGNSYGHPKSEVLSRLDSLGAEIFRTDKQGSVIVESNGSEYSVSSTKGLIER